MFYHFRRNQLYDLPIYNLKDIVPEASFMLSSFYALLRWLNISENPFRCPVQKLLSTHSKENTVLHKCNLNVTCLVILRQV